MDAILLIADDNVRRRGELRRFFWDSGFLVAAAEHGLECLTKLRKLEPHVLVLSVEIPWRGGDEVIARLNSDPAVNRKPLVLVIGNAPAATLSARSGAAACNCFSTPFCRHDLLERIGIELAAKFRALEMPGNSRPKNMISD
jgi:CheY-like chemotaxis protein